MTTNAVSTFLFNDQSRTDFARLQRQLLDLQRQVGSGAKADDLKGYGDASARILSARGMIAQTDAHNAAAQTLSSRLDMVDKSLNQTADAAEEMRLSVLNAIANNDGRFLADMLNTQFAAARSALNVTFEGETLFGGERIDGTPINAANVDELAAAAATSDIFDESDRVRTMDIGSGSMQIADKASTIGADLFDAMRELKLLLDANGGTLPKPLTDAQNDALEALAADFGAARQTVLLAQGRNGQLQEHVEKETERLTAQSDTLAKVVSDVADADPAEVAMRLAAAQVQYQAVAAVYSQLSSLSLLDYLE